MKCNYNFLKNLCNVEKSGRKCTEQYLCLGDETMGDIFLHMLNLTYGVCTTSIELFFFKERKQEGALLRGKKKKKKE